MTQNDPKYKRKWITSGHFPTKHPVIMMFDPHKCKLNFLKGFLGFLRNFDFLFILHVAINIYPMKHPIIMTFSTQNKFQVDCRGFFRFCEISISKGSKVDLNDICQCHQWYIPNGTYSDCDIEWFKVNRFWKSWLYHPLRRRKFQKTPQWDCLCRQQGNIKYQWYFVHSTKFAFSKGDFFFFFFFFRF